MKTPNEVPNNAEFGLLVAFLASNGSITGPELRQVLGNSPAGRTRQEIADELRAWLRDRPAQESGDLAGSLGSLPGKLQSAGGRP